MKKTRGKQQTVMIQPSPDRSLCNYNQSLQSNDHYHIIVIRRSVLRKPSGSLQGVMTVERRANAAGRADPDATDKCVSLNIFKEKREHTPDVFNINSNIFRYKVGM